ncbi:MAG: hypothetical protein GVY28_13140, partial [Alphaproteobacteria bacterium]|nr:hypothetical protein [Alphaproteobacteria bacterium]
MAGAPTVTLSPAATKPDAPKQVTQSAQVADIQRYLKRLGYEAGPVDGVMGSRTRTAIRAYQQDRGLLATGQPSAALRDNLRERVVERFGSADAPAEEDAADDDGAPTSLIAGIQRDLGRLGYAVPTTDGRLTAETRAAIRAYQRDAGLLVTGEPSAALRDHVADRLAERDGDDAAADDALDADAIATIQSELRRRGYGIAAVSGEVDAGTRAAIRAYQRDTGRTVTGEPSRALLDRLTRAESGTPEGPTADQIAGLQRALNQRGYEAGPVDGVLGPSTRTAIRTYQSDSGLEPTGRVSADLLARLGITGEGEADDGSTGDDGGTA